MKMNEVCRGFFLPEVRDFEPAVWSWAQMMSGSKLR